ncbi:MAG: HoxN/HupN/NixA family nickel/cobalt transporter [Pseudomonadota bacterium]|nr:HoxN/HupN/NixA family nickel/cobalt transporter [Pseudomonadota bacterium]
MRFFRSPDRRRIVGLYSCVASLHIVGWGLYLHYSGSHTALLGLGLIAYMFGVRHAFDADHIAAVDDTVRYLLQQGKRPAGIGFFFSLGHSTVVSGLAVCIAFAAAAVKQQLPQLKNIGGLLGAGVSGLFLWLIGILNLLVLLDLSKAWREAKTGAHDHAQVDRLLRQRGLMNRLFGGRLQTLISHSWQMYPLGLLFGLGFDTASEVGLLAITAGASAGRLPVPAVLSLPILFAAGMTLVDTTDGILMRNAYEWALIHPRRKIFYNITMTAVSVVVALVAGTIDLSQGVIGMLGLHGASERFITALDLGFFGYAIVGLFFVAWGLSVAIWKGRKLWPRAQPMQ